MLNVGQFDIKHFTTDGDYMLQEWLIGVELRSLSNMTMRYMEANSHKSYVDSVTGTNGWIIGAIASHPDRDLFQRDLEEMFGVTRSTASKVVNLMVQKGLIEKTPVDYDARLKKLTLTEKAEELVDFMLEDNMMMEKTLTKGFDDEEIAMLLSYIDRMKKNLKGFSGEPVLKRV